MNQNQMVDQLCRYLQEILYTPDKAYIEADKISQPYQKLIAALNQLHRYIQEQNQYCQELEAGRVDTTLEISKDNVLARPLKSVQGMLQYLTGVMHHIAEGDDQQRMLVVNDISRSFNAMIERLSVQFYLDKVTGLWNEEGFSNAVQKALESDEEGNTYGLVYIHFTDYEQLRAVYGDERSHAECRQIAEWMQNVLGSKELCGCLGEGKFVNFLKTVSLNDMQKRFKMAADFLTYRHPAIRCGCYVVRERSMSVKDMIGRAAFACNSIAKDNKTKYITFDVDMDRQYYQEKSLLCAFQDFPKKSSFYVQYQPQIDCKTSQIVRCEALVRWTDLQEKTVLPEAFLPLLERYGLRRQLDMYVLLEVCRFLRKGMDRGLPMVPVSVAVSPKTLVSEKCVSSIMVILQQFRLEPEWIVLEVGDALYDQNNDVLQEVLQELHQKGFRLETTGLGKNGAALGLVGSVSADMVKLGPSFLAQQDKRSEAVVEAMLRLAKKLNIETVVDGVELRETVVFLRQCGCDSVQGPYYYHPLDEAVWERLMEESNKKQG